MKVQFKDGIYTWTTPGKGKKTHCGISAPPGFEWIKITDMEITERIYDGCDCYPWHEVFAWLPVKTVSGRYVWLEKVFKRKFWVVWGRGFHMEPHVEYGTFFDIIKHD